MSDEQKKLSRRDLFVATAAAGAGVALGGHLAGDVQAQAPAPAAGQPN